MKLELEEKLIKDFPMLYRDHNASMQTTCMCWGFSCGDGWYDLIYDLSKALTEYAELKKFEIIVVQVKEKYGTLRFYVQGEDHIISALIGHAVNQSRHTCEECGKYGSLRGLGWVQTLCDECAEKAGYLEEDEEEEEPCIFCRVLKWLKIKWKKFGN
jgi:hypothetical protein